MAVKAIQLIQIGTAMGSEEKARETIRLMKEAGYDGIELNGFMMKKMPPIVRVLTTLAGMPIGKTAKLDWKKLIADTGLKVVSIHEDLGSILRNPQEIMEEAKTFSTKYIVITGMHRFDYSNMAAVLELAPVSYTHLRAHETGRNLVCRLLLEKKKKKNKHRHDIVCSIE